MTWLGFASALIASVLSFISGIYLAKFKRRNELADKAVDKAEDEAKKGAEAQVEELRAETGEQFVSFRREINEQFDKVGNSISEIKNSVKVQGENIERIALTQDALCRKEVADSYNTLRKEMLMCIRQDKVSEATRQRLDAAFHLYKALPNANGYLDDTHTRFMALRVEISPDDLEQTPQI